LFFIAECSYIWYQEILILWETMRQRRVKNFIMLYVLMHIWIVLIRRHRCRIVQVRQPSWYDPVARSQSLSKIFTSNRECIDQLLGHDQKDRAIHKEFQRSTDTISRSFHKVLTSILKLWRILLKKPQPIPSNYSDDRWKWFEVCNRLENYNIF
jgi:hypothetical protein